MPKRVQGSAWGRAAWLAAALVLAACLTVVVAVRFSKHTLVGGSSRGPTVVFTGMCDASSAIALTDHLFLVANDEDNVLRAYDARTGGMPMWEHDVSPDLNLPIKTNGPAETDIEAATRLGDYAYFLTSHGRSRAGKRKPERLRFFATTANANGNDIRMIGAPYERLLDDLLTEPRLKSLDLREAAERAPGEDHGLNIEGMTARIEGGVWVGFRSPIPNGNALVVPLLNPERVIQGTPAELGEPALLALNGLGIRGMATWRGRYLVLAGPASGGAVSYLFSWDGQHNIQRAEGVDLSDLNPEGFFTLDQRTETLVLSDDGTVRVDGTVCKRLEDPTKRRFRGRWIGLRP